MTRFRFSLFLALILGAALTAALAALGLAAIMAGAVVSHAIHDPIQQALPALVLLALGGVAFYGVVARLTRRAAPWAPETTL